MIADKQAEERVVSPLVAAILAKRGVALEAMRDFLYPDYERDVHDPGLMMDMAAAVERIVVAAERGERVVVYGDYDIDGLTASAVLIEGLRTLGVEARSYIPDRFEEGYGLNVAALERLAGEGAQLVISVDCGITSVVEAAWAREHGLDLIITDHHTPPAVLPEAVAVVNPKRPGDAYPFKELCGAGVAFKLVQALQTRTGKPAAGQEKWLLDLVALGTVCDVVDLVGENRVLVSYGLRVLRRTRRPGLRALAVVAGLELETITAQQLGFGLGPRMNAAGRLDHASRALELLMTADASRALTIADELEALNRQRRADQDRVLAAAEAMADQYVDEPVLVLAAEDWSHGIVGIVASKLVERWHKPVLVAQVLGDHIKGSARSIGTYNMVEALRAQSELLTKFGGHFYAAGYTLPADNLAALRAGLGEYYRMSAAEAVELVIEPDLVLADLAAVDWPLLEELALLEPFGAANPEPRLELSGLVVREVARMGQTRTHLRLAVGDTAGRRLGCVGFGMAERHGELQPGQVVRLTGFLNKNEWRGQRMLQLKLADIAYE